MKKYFLFVLTLICAAPLTAQQTGNIGAGVLVGDPFGPTVKIWTTPAQAINLGIGFNDLALYGDYEWHSWRIFPQPDPGYGRIAGYAALGAKLEDQEHDDTLFGFRTMLGVSYWLPRNPIEIFAEVGPVFEISPDVDTHMDGGVGIRFYFNRGR